jgi:hypothetical protein
MQEVKPHSFSLGILETLETICYDGWTDELMDGWMKTQFHMGQMNMNETHDMHRQNSYSIPDPRAPSGVLSQNPKWCFPLKLKVYDP